MDQDRRVRSVRVPLASESSNMHRYAAKQFYRAIEYRTLRPERSHVQPTKETTLKRHGEIAFALGRLRIGILESTSGHVDLKLRSPRSGI